MYERKDIPSMNPERYRTEEKKETPIHHPLTPHLRAEERYYNDPTFRCVVDSLTAAIAKLEMTPAEVREAAVYACIRFEHLNMAHVQRYIRDGALPTKLERDMRGELDRCQERARDLERYLSLR
jgi:hypothetical protein